MRVDPHTPRPTDDGPPPAPVADDGRAEEFFALLATVAPTPSGASSVEGERGSDACDPDGEGTQPGDRADADADPGSDTASADAPVRAPAAGERAPRSDPLGTGGAVTTIVVAPSAPAVVDGVAPATVVPGPVDPSSIAPPEGDPGPVVEDGPTNAAKTMVPGAAPGAAAGATTPRAPERTGAPALDATAATAPTPPTPPTRAEPVPIAASPLPGEPGPASTRAPEPSAAPAPLTAPAPPAPFAPFAPSVEPVAPGLPGRVPRLETLTGEIGDPDTGPAGAARASDAPVSTEAPPPPGHPDGGDPPEIAPVAAVADAAPDDVPAPPPRSSPDQDLRPATDAGPAIVAAPSPPDGASVSASGAAAVAPSAPETTPPGATAPPATTQVARAVESLRRVGGGHGITLELSPPELGTIHLDVRVHDGVVSVRVRAESVATGDALRDGLADLQRQLEDLGLRTGHLSVGQQQARDNPRPAPHDDRPDAPAASDAPDALPTTTEHRRAGADALVDVLL
ncbi:MAG: flagellar hook-length control protein FliK [Acidimicrobiia bacterium]